MYFVFQEQAQSTKIHETRKLKL